ncbi:hypothetical protein [Sinorhizobium sp. 6-70]|uniref:hypothetical protein n=1 Tax=Sinorhizobium sp. 6-70 TaxID=3049088 RepID=UPI0024C407EF|nr:hypothetical protein [Sinorhizobium sp. 6-70]
MTDIPIATIASHKLLGILNRFTGIAIIITPKNILCQYWHMLQLFKKNTKIVSKPHGFIGVLDVAFPFFAMHTPARNLGSLPMMHASNDEEE